MFMQSFAVSSLFHLCCEQVASDVKLTSHALLVLPLQHVVQSIADYAVARKKTLVLTTILRYCPVKRLIIRVQGDSTAFLHAATVISSRLSSMCTSEFERDLNETFGKLNVLELSRCSSSRDATHVQYAEKGSLLLATSLLPFFRHGKSKDFTTVLQILMPFTVTVQTIHLIELILKSRMRALVRCFVTAVTFRSVNSDSIKTILSCLHQEYLYEIDVGFIGMGDKILQEILDLMNHFQHLQFFGFAYNNVGKESTLVKLCNVFSQFPDLEGVDCSGNWINEKSTFLPRLLSSFRKCPCKLMLSCVGQRAIRSLVDQSSLPISHVKELVLSGNNLAGSFTALQQILSVTINLRLLDLSSNGFSDENVGALAPVIMDLKKLQVLILSGLSCSISSLECFAEVLSSLPMLQQLHFDDVDIPTGEFNLYADLFGLKLSENISLNLKREFCNFVRDRLESRCRQSGRNSMVSFTLSSSSSST